MIKFLKLNRVLMFLLLVIPWFIIYFINFEDPFNVTLISLLGSSLLLIWFSWLDYELIKRIPKNIEISDTLFFINLFLFFFCYCIIIIFVGPGEKYEFSGLKALPFLYIFYAIFQIYNHLSKLITFVEEEKEVEFSKRVGEMVLFFFFFIGIWWLQPRIIKALNKPEIINEKYISMSEREAMNMTKEDNNTSS